MKGRWIHVSWSVALIFLVTSAVAAAQGPDFQHQVETATGSEPETIRFHNLDRLSPDGEWLAYVTASDYGMRDSRIWISRPDGTEAKVIVTGGTNFWVSNPVWAPDSEQLAYVRVYSGEESFAVAPAFELWVVHLSDMGDPGHRIDIAKGAFNLMLGYGGETTLAWEQENRITFLNEASAQPARYSVDPETNVLSEEGVVSNEETRAVLSQPSGVPCFWQHDTWRCDQLGYNSAWTLGTCPNKHSGGCTVSSVAMILNYYGISTNPRHLNQWLKDNSGFIGANMRLDIAANVDPSIEFGNEIAGTNWTLLRSQLDEGYPVLLKVLGGSHWVVATGYSGNTVYINDPGLRSCARTLEAYGNTFDSLTIYEGNLPNPHDTTPPSVTFTSNPSPGQWYNTSPTISWRMSDAESGISSYEWWWAGQTHHQVSKSGNPSPVTDSTGLSTAGQGWHRIYVRAWNGEGLSVREDVGPFGYDTVRPNAPSINPGCNAPNNQWQNTCRDPSFTWSAIDPNGSDGSGIEYYAYAWGTSPPTDPSNWSTTQSYNPGAIADVDSWNQHSLYVRARDEAGNISSLGRYGVWYDGSIPTVTLSINNGASTTNQTNVHLNLSTDDTGSGISEIRISNNGLTWSEWQPYADIIPWTLPALDRRELPVYAQVRDHAGNESTIASDTITLDLYPPMPHSDNYRICQDVIDVGGSVGISSTSYSLTSAIGQSWATGANANASDGFSGRSGFLADVTGCLPITHTATSSFTITRWVVASGGNLRSSGSYRLGDTTGQPAASGANDFSSPNYTLSSGFWGQITGTVPTTSTQPTPEPTPVPTATPTPGPTPTPQPDSFGVSINYGALYTNDPLVTVRLWGPNVTHMRISNDGGFTESYWRSYQITATWPLSTYGSYVMPRLVYAQFKDAHGAIYGTFMDDIIYDPVAPEGNVVLLSSPDTVTATVWLESWDDNSGVDEMRVADTLGGIDAASWQPYTETLSWVLQGSQVYAQFRDHAGNPSSIYDSNGIEHPLNPKTVYLPLVIRND